ncbi:ADP-ribosylation/Crystallin J1 [Dichotomopilus funicola]|uniref:ADP-ribosylhydrolase ARH3 n=1 Tax=Dichotomopilus funicola TaxID=1934379 RepID=A0AAN6UZV9_9PEZI|nr:ADP-ribosylation/Crystallin J1 [Dichotomopilus funicola]
MSTPTRRDRILGALLGVHAGDSLGATVEFASWEDIRTDYPTGVRDIVGGGPFNWPAGHATDDTDLTRAVLLAYRDVAKHSQSNSPSTSSTSDSSKQGEEATPDITLLAAVHMLSWYIGHNWPDRNPNERPVDVGGATATGLTRFQRTGDPRSSGAGQGSAGNGSLMRCIPTALFQRDRAKLIRESVEISGVTHDDLCCVVACAVYNVMVGVLVHEERGTAAVEGAWRAGKGAVEEAMVESAGRKVDEALDAGRYMVRVQDLAEKGPKKATNATKAIPFGATGYVLESLVLAVAALFDPRSLEEVLVDVVRFGGDTDTNGAIAGGMLGARDGVDAIPLRWREVLQFGTEFTEVAEYLLSVREKERGD